MHDSEPPSMCRTEKFHQVLPNTPAPWDTSGSPADYSWLKKRGMYWAATHVIKHYFMMGTEERVDLKRITLGKSAQPQSVVCLNPSLAPAVTWCWVYVVHSSVGRVVKSWIIHNVMHEGTKRCRPNTDKVFKYSFLCSNVTVFIIYTVDARQRVVDFINNLVQKIEKVERGTERTPEPVWYQRYQMLGAGVGIVRHRCSRDQKLRKRSISDALKIWLKQDTRYDASKVTKRLQLNSIYLTIYLLING